MRCLMGPTCIVVLGRVQWAGTLRPQVVFYRCRHHSASALQMEPRPATPSSPPQLRNIAVNPTGLMLAPLPCP
ncbi:hypothetical protein D3C86_1980910 [compost metagenome]